MLYHANTCKKICYRQKDQQTHSAAYKAAIAAKNSFFFCKETMCYIIITFDNPFYIFTVLFVSHSEKMQPAHFEAAIHFWNT